MKVGNTKAGITEDKYTSSVQGLGAELEYL